MESKNKIEFTIKNRPEYDYITDDDMEIMLTEYKDWFEGFKKQEREKNRKAKKIIEIRLAFAHAHSFAQLWYWKGYLDRGKEILDDG